MINKAHADVLNSTHCQEGEIEKNSQRGEGLKKKFYEQVRTKRRVNIDEAPERWRDLRVTLVLSFPRTNKAVLFCPVC